VLAFAEARVTTAAATTFDAKLELACRCTYSAAVAGLGVMIALTGDLGTVFQPVPSWLPLQHGLAYGTAVLLVACGLALAARKTTPPASLVLAVNFFFVWLLLFHGPTVLAGPGSVGNWEGCGLTMGILSGPWILFARSHRAPAGLAARLTGDSGQKFARRLFAAGMPLVGVAHFADPVGGTDYVPTWLPLRIDWVYVTGAGHVAAGLAILFGVLPALAALLEAAQITAFIVLTHVPAVASAPADRVQWAMLLHAVAIGASSWLVVLTFREDVGHRPPSRGRPKDGRDETAATR
jgi:uncharacterized membrane protein